MKRGFWGSAKPAALPLGEIRASTIPVTSLKKGNYEPILRAIGDSSVVMIGESTHGTQEYYQMRAEITKALITRYGFNIVAVEGDWPDVYRVNRFVQQGQTADRTAVESLADFERFPKWMWRNEVVVEFIEWLEQHNRTQGAGKKTGFYGLDLYSMYASSHKVIEYLEKVDPPMARLAKKRYGTLDRFRDDPHEYATEVMLGLTPSCEREVVQMLTDIVKKGPEYMKKLGYLDGDELFYTKENATLVKDAEEYYRKAYAGGVVTWNLRDRHMMQTLEHLLDYQSSRSDRPAKAVVWAHNSHLGDARATNVSRQGEWNIGQLVREKFGLGRSYNIGFTTFNGTVRAAKKWGGIGEVMELNDALPDSYETLFHNVVGSASKERDESKRRRDESKRRRDEDANKATGSGSRAAQPSTPPSAMEVGGELVPPPDGGAAAVDFGVTGGEESDNGDFALVLRTNNKEVSIDERLIKVLLETRPERAVGVQYVKNPQREVTAHYFDTCLPRQFDSVIHIDKTSALQALEN